MCYFSDRFTAVLCLAIIIFSFSAPDSYAAVEPAVVRKVLGKASAPPHTVLPPGSVFTTGVGGKSELAVKRGIVRVGQRADLQATTRGLAVRQGITLVASEPGRFRKTIEVQVPGYKLQVSGTVQVAYEPGRALKVVVLEGSANVALDSFMGEFEVLRPGQMLVINPSDSRLPNPLEVDIQRLVATSGLIGGDWGPLATLASIESGARSQVMAAARGDVVPTNLLLRGNGTTLETLRDRLPPVPPEQPREPPSQRILETPPIFDDPTAITPRQAYIFDVDEDSSTIGNFEFKRNELNKTRTHFLFVELSQHLRSRLG